MFSLWTGLECAILNHLFLKVFVLILAGMEAGAPCRVSKQYVSRCFMHLEGTDKSCKSGRGPFFLCAATVPESDQTNDCFFFPSLVEKKGKGIANSFMQTDSLQKPLASYVSLGLSFFNHSMQDNITIRPDRVAVKLPLDIKSLEQCLAHSTC